MIAVSVMKICREERPLIGQMVGAFTPLLPECRSRRHSDDSRFVERTHAFKVIRSVVPSVVLINNEMKEKQLQRFDL